LKKSISNDQLFLAGKEYGIDIMSVKESPRRKFTLLAERRSLRRGVYNLRGEIIP
jgi:chemotaxis signal transduction protein